MPVMQFAPLAVLPSAITYISLSNNCALAEYLKKKAIKNRKKNMRFGCMIIF
jgi:hypothetical protein